MLPKNHRLDLSREFRHLKKRSFSLETPYFSLLYDRETRGGPSRFGFVVSNKIGKAVVRNRARRLLRAAVEADLAAFPEGLKLVFIAKAKMVGVTFEVISTEIHSLLPKIRS